ncbi:P-loop containing nucleoside triphosphate hydrolase protein [Gorgonomyces haynaldii]|nr:P-loop containing nucleoside triphosphate hydrolase protein [Gorgonomyces haynaldii]
MFEFQQYTKHSTQLISLVNDLRDLGAQVDLDLPTVVVCGNQSVGKSSVIESICGIPLPRGQGTCTRSVIEVRLREGPTWSCTIKLRHEYKNDKPLTDIQEVPFGSKITTPAIVETFIRRAQKALLNPSKDPNTFLRTEFGPDGDTDRNQLKFTRDVVCVDIEGAPTTLTLIDLPGIIRSVEREEDKQLIDMIEDLVKFYIAKQRAIILAVISCKDEIENQAIFHLARQVDPLGYRTIGVLTKPDTIEPGTHDRWVQVLLGNQYSLKSGYFMVKCPSKTESEQIKRIEDGLALEQQYFTKTQPWSSLVLGTNRFGIQMLRAEISRSLAALVESSIPEMRKTTEKSMEEVSKILDTLPPPVNGDGKIELLQSIRQFSTLVNYHIHAQQNLKAFHQKIRRHFEIFRDTIVATRPRLISQKEEKSTTSASSFITGTILGLGRSSEDIRKSVKKDNHPNAFSMADLQSMVSQQRGRELDGMYPYGALETLVTKFQEDWKAAAAHLVSQVSQELKNLITGLTEDVFVRFTQLQGLVRMVMNGFQAELQRLALEQVHVLLVMEKRGPFTMHSAGYMRAKSECLDQLLTGGQWAESGSPEKNQAMKRAITALVDLGVQGLTPQTLMTRLSASSGSWASEAHLLDLFASAMGYFDISSARLVDNVCMTVDYHFLEKFGTMLEKELIHHLGILSKSQQELEGLLKEDWTVQEKRERARERQQRLSRVWKRLQEFGLNTI